MLVRPFSRGLSPWREIERLQREMNSLLSGTSRWPGLSAASSYPAMNVWTDQDSVVVTAELPGVEPEDIDISVKNDTLTLSGSRKPDEAQEVETYHRRERGSGSFTRSFQLPFQVEPDKVEASYRKGILNITLPRAEADKPEKIAIKAG
ncbi:MAG: Hsp20/alpha crystallin family protein [Anaerolineae bacterium]|nr:Hsp20/alpha crystallin family protein [Anaerolineae bacterium]